MAVEKAGAQVEREEEKAGKGVAGAVVGMAVAKEEVAGEEEKAVVVEEVLEEDSGVELRAAGSVEVEAGSAAVVDMEAALAVEAWVVVEVELARAGMAGVTGVEATVVAVHRSPTTMAVAGAGAASMAA